MKKKPEGSVSRTPARQSGRKDAEPPPGPPSRSSGRPSARGSAQPSTRAADVQDELRSLADPAQASHLARFFKTGPDEYGEGVRFLGIRVPEQRKIAKKHRDLPLEEVAVLVRSEFHEERLTGLLILTYRYPKSSPVQKEALFNFYITHIPWINNWDLVDVTAPNIVGAWLVDRLAAPDGGISLCQRLALMSPSGDSCKAGEVHQREANPMAMTSSPASF
jgi:hypothetical protein